MDLASALASNVLPTPGTSSMSTCPSASSTVIASLIASGLPEITVSTAALTRWATGTSSSSLLLSAWFPVSTTTCPPRVTLGALLGPPAELRSVGRRGRASDSTTCGAAHATRAHPPAAGLAPAWRRLAACRPATVPGAPPSCRPATVPGAHHRAGPGPLPPRRSTFALGTSHRAPRSASMPGSSLRAPCSGAHPALFHRHPSPPRSTTVTSALWGNLAQTAALDRLRWVNVEYGGG